MPSYETEDGRPRYGQRLSPEELAEYLREQGIEPPAARAADDAGRSSATGDPQSRLSDDVDPYGAPTHGARPARADDDADRGAPAASWRTGGTTQPATGTRRDPGSRGSGRTGRSRWGLLVVGLVLLLVVPLILMTLAVTRVVDGPLSGGTSLGGSGVVYLDAGDRSAVYSSALGASTPECTVTDPSGGDVALDDSGATGLSYAAFTAQSSGRYTVSCPGGTEGMVIGPQMNPDRITQSAILMMTALGVGAVGLGTTIAGGVRAARRPRSQSAELGRAPR